MMDAFAVTGSKASASTGQRHVLAGVSRCRNFSRCTLGGENHGMAACATKMQIVTSMLSILVFFWDGTGEFEDFKNAEVVVDALTVDDSKSISLMAV